MPGESVSTRDGGGKKGDDKHRKKRGDGSGGRSPSLHYSPRKTQPPKCSAAKSAPLPPKRKTDERPSKVEEPTPKTAQKQSDVVNAALNRANTAELPPDPKAAGGGKDRNTRESGKGGGGDPEDSSNDSGENNSDDGSSGEHAADEPERDTLPDVHGPTLEQVRAKKQAHARYMRFSRSLKRSLVAINICFFCCNYINYCS